MLFPGVLEADTSAINNDDRKDAPTTKYPTAKGLRCMKEEKEVLGIVVLRVVYNSY